jgi:hypothetical protein
MIWGGVKISLILHVLVLWYTELTIASAPFQYLIFVAMWIPNTAAVLKLWSRQCLVRSRFNVCLKLLDFVSRIHTYLLTCYLLAVCETKCCGIIDQSLFYIDLTVHYIYKILKIWLRPAWFYLNIVYRSTANFAHCVSWDHS